MDFEKNWKQALLPLDATIHQAIQCLNDSALQIALVVSTEGVLQGTVTDGDIRRGLLQGLSLSDSLDGILNRKPFVVPSQMQREDVLRIMEMNKVHQLPVIDKNRCIIGMHRWDMLKAPKIRPNVMIIMAGGLGSRLRPHTEQCPKPLLPVAGKPMLEHIIERAKLAGFQRFILAIGYLGHMIESYFGNGSLWDIKIDYIREDSPLGTAGALGLIEPISELPIVVTNGDVLTEIKYAELLDFHDHNQASATMAVRMFEWTHPFGVVQVDGIDIIGFEEKPNYKTNVNAGVYAINASVLALLQKNNYCDMPTLFERLIALKKRVIVYPIHEPWLDVGRPDDYEQAMRSFMPNPMNETITK